jgi:hypothetical protein
MFFGDLKETFYNLSVRIRETLTDLQK